MKKNKFIHIHIPKTAGGSVLQILRMNFPHAILEDVWLPVSAQIIRADQVKMILELHPGRHVYSSHRITLDLPFDDVENLVALVFVREPVSHTLSSYYYARAMEAEQIDAHLPLANEVSFEDFIGLMMEGQDGAGTFTETYLTMSLGKQAQFLFGARNAVDFSRLDTLIEQKRLVLFPSNRFDEACVALEFLYPDEFHNCAYPTAGNVTGGGQMPFNPALRGRIEALTQTDSVLFDRANRFLDAVLAGAYPDARLRNQALQRFSARRKVAAEAPPDWEKAVPFDVRLFLRTRRLLGRALRGALRRARNHAINPLI